MSSEGNNKATAGDEATATVVTAGATGVTGATGETAAPTGAVLKPTNSLRITPADPTTPTTGGTPASTGAQSATATATIVATSTNGGIPGSNTMSNVNPGTANQVGMPMINPQYLAYLQALASYQAQLGMITAATAGIGGATATATTVQAGGTAGPAPPGTSGGAIPPGAMGAGPMILNPQPMNLTVKESNISVKIPTFYGDSSDGSKTTAYKFREMVERAQNLNRWNPRDTAEMAQHHLAGEAAEWSERMLRSIRPEERAMMETWPTMRVAFMKRFDVAPTAVQKIAKISNISQYQKETAKRYYDRLREALDYIGKDTFMNPPAGGGTWEEGFLAAMGVIFETFYLRGLDPKIRLQVQAQLGKDCSLEQLVEKANEVDELIKEESQSNVKKIMMAPMRAAEEPRHEEETGGEDWSSMVEKKIKEELNLITGQIAGMGAGRGKKTGGKTGGATTGSKKQSTGGIAIPMKDRDWVLCYACRQWGQHFAHECGLTKDEAKSLTRMSAKDKPQGKARDSQFGTSQGN